LGLFSGNTRMAGEMQEAEGFAFEEPQSSGPHLTLKDVEVNYTLLKETHELEALARKMATVKSFSFDTETSNINPHLCDIIGFSLCYTPGEAWYICCPGDAEDDEARLKVFKDLFENEEIEKVGQNIKYDMIVLKNHGIQLKGPLFDTMIAHYLIEPDMRHNLDMLSERYLNYTPISITELLGKSGKKQLNMRDLLPEDIKDYACEDADVAFKLRDKLDAQIIKASTKKLFVEVEARLIEVLADMERVGINIDVDALNAYSIELEADMRILEQEVYDLAGLPFNINSPMQLGEILFEKMMLDPKAKRTAKSKQYSTNEEVLSKLAAQHDIARKILDYRSLQKLKSTYVDSLPLLRNPRTHRIHTSFNQAVAATGRLSSTDPNMQNIPIRTEKGREIRKAFIPRDDAHVILSADYSQIELRLIAELSGDEGMSEAFRLKHDIHTSTAGKIYNVNVEAVTPEMRRRAKMVNFGIIYGISAFGLSQRLSISRTEAANIISQYNRQYPRINQYLHDRIEFAKRHGYVETVLGRRRYLRDINSGNATQRGYAERNAINAPIQGSAADMIKIAMINIHDVFRKEKFRSRMVLQVHDELVFDARKDELDRIKPIIEEKMQDAIPLKIPIEVGIGVGNNWLEAH
ncbi:MAG: DNA polymerase I, partial [Bacteroidota bacterium]|nr:DNA polymerase I [Bacteroidota bacterium]